MHVSGSKYIKYRFYEVQFLEVINIRHEIPIKVSHTTKQNRSNQPEKNKIITEIF